jgi:uncharacterized membrane protein
MNRWLCVSIVLTVLTTAGPLYLYYGRPDLLREQIPTHSNAAGEVDKWTPRDQILPQWLLLPGVMGFFVLLTLVLPWLSPQGFKVDTFRETFSFLMSVVVALFGYIQLLLVLGGIEGVRMDSTRWILGGVSLFFSLLGNRLGKVQRNFWMGVRTPWTLASEVVWIGTHRLTAWLWVPGGVLLALVGFVGPSLVPMTACIIVWMAGLLLMALTPVVYSLLLYKRLERQGKIAAPPAPLSEELR